MSVKTLVAFALCVGCSVAPVWSQSYYQNNGYQTPNSGGGFFNGVKRIGSFAVKGTAGAISGFAQGQRDNYSRSQASKAYTANQALLNSASDSANDSQQERWSSGRLRHNAGYANNSSSSQFGAASISPYSYPSLENPCNANNSSASQFGSGNVSPYSSPSLRTNSGYAGNLSINQFAPGSVNPYNNSYLDNKFSTGGPALIDSKGGYHGRLNGNSFDPESVSNPYGRYGSQYSPDSINNKYGAGSPYAQNSPYNQFGTGMRVVNP